MTYPRTRPPGTAGFTIMEVMASAMLISISMISIMTVNAKSVQSLRIARETAASSQVLQQRIEMVRDHGWTDVASAPAMQALLGTGTESEAEMGDTRLVETVRVSRPDLKATGLVEGPAYFLVRRANGVATVEQAGDFSDAPTLFFEGSATWKNQSGVHQRTLRTIICRAGLTRSGVAGSVLGRPGTETATP